MMPIIRISDEVMNMLKKFAEPFEDTPDSVLRKILNDYIGMKKIGNQGKPVPSQGATEHLRESLPGTIPSDRFARRSRSVLTRPMTDLQTTKAVQRVLYGWGERYARWIVVALEALGGSASAKEVTNYIKKVFGREFTEREREDIPSGGEIRWLKCVHWAKYDMARGGLLNENAPRGVWELTDKGKTFYK